LNDPWLESAVVGAAARAPIEFIEAALDSKNAEGLTGLVGTLTSNLATKQEAAQAGRLVTLLASKPASANGAKQIILERLAKELKPETVPAWSDGLRNALKSLLGSSNTQLSAAALPIVARWDKSGALKDDVKTLVTSLTKRLNDESLADDQRAQVIQASLGCAKSVRTFSHPWRSSWVLPSPRVCKSARSRRWAARPTLGGQVAQQRLSELSTPAGCCLCPIVSGPIGPQRLSECSSPATSNWPC
jgi:hypothetical protein